jgi:hypothetical protein
VGGNRWLNRSMAAVVRFGVPIPQANALVGTWHHKSDGSAIILRANGTASLEDVPKNALLNLPDKPGGQAENLEGTWAMGGPLDEKRDNGDPVLTIDVRCKRKERGSTYLFDHAHYFWDGFKDHVLVDHRGP